MREDLVIASPDLRSGRGNLIKIIYGIASLTLAMTATATAAVKNPDTFVELRSGGSDVTSLDPAFPYDTTSFEIIMNIYEPLIWYKGLSTKEFEPLLAQKVPSLKNGLLSPDGKTYIFPIRSNVKFHDGTPLVCEDSRYSLLRFMLQDPAGGPASLLLEPIAGLQGTRDKEGSLAVDFKDLSSRLVCEGQNLKITLPRPYGPFLSIMAQWSYVVSKKWAVEHGGWDGAQETWAKFNNPKKETSHLFDHANGTGSFMLEKWERDIKQIILARNDRYWRKPASMKRVVVKQVPEFNTRRLMIASGDADYIEETGRQFENQLNNIPGVKTVDLPYLRVEGIYFTFDINPVANPALYSGKLDGEGIPPNFFADDDVRKGFAYAFDYEAYIRDVLKNKAYRPTGCVPKGLLGHNPNQKIYSFNPEKARDHFKAAWNGQVWDKGFRVMMYYDVNNEGRHMACEILKKNVERLNPEFKIDVRPLQWSTYLAEARSHKLPLFKLGWLADFADPHNFAFAFLHSQGNYPYEQRFSFPEWDELVEKANAEPNPQAREALYYRLQSLAFEKVPQIYTDMPLGFRVIRDWVKGYTLNPIFPGLYYYPISKSEEALDSRLRGNDEKL